jgi:hypothetical protein
MTLAGGTNAIEKVPGTVGICDNCGLPNVPLHMASTRAVFCTTCAQDMVGVGLYCWVDSLPADREAVIQVLGGSPLNTPIVTEHPLSPYIELPQDPSFVVGPDGNKWEILEEVTTDGLPCPECLVQSARRVGRKKDILCAAP